MLSLVKSPVNKIQNSSLTEKDHLILVAGFLQSHRTRNHSAKTIIREKLFLEGWFASHSCNSQPLHTWEAMAPVTGRKRILDYSAALLDSGLSTDTIRAYLGILSRYFSYVLEHPYILGTDAPRRIQDCYGAIDQPISEYDMPHHSYDGERAGVPMDPACLYSFYSILRQKYLEVPGGCRALRARNYAMAVLAGETGLRIDELLHLEIKHDLFFDSQKLQTRFAKGTSGSGKRARITLFPPLARDTVRFYLNNHRSKISGSETTDYLFPTKTGNVMNYTAVHSALKIMIKSVRSAGFSVGSNMSWHWFRRIFATRFIEQFPEKLPVLITLLGHMSPNTVHRYIRHSEAWMDKQMQSVLEGEFNGH